MSEIVFVLSLKSHLQFHLVYMSRFKIIFFKTLEVLLNIFLELKAAEEKSDSILIVILL